MTGSYEYLLRTFRSVTTHRERWPSPFPRIEGSLGPSPCARCLSNRWPFQRVECREGSESSLPWALDQCRRRHNTPFQRWRTSKARWAPRWRCATSWRPCHGFLMDASPVRAVLGQSSLAMRNCMRCMHQKGLCAHSYYPGNRNAHHQFLPRLIDMAGLGF